MIRMLMAFVFLGTRALGGEQGGLWDNGTIPVHI